MTLWLRDIALPWGEDETLLPVVVARQLRVDPDTLSAFRVIRRALDARQKPRLRHVYTVEFAAADEAALLSLNQGNPRLQTAPCPVAPDLVRIADNRHVLVVGMGPAGLFAALRLAECGVRVTLLERGSPVEQRVRDVEQFWSGGPLVAGSNVQFGEGGAGTFSDGKLSTRLNHPWLRRVLEILVTFGADPDILVEARPHIGTDRLRRILISFRQRLQSLGVNLHYQSCLTGLEVAAGRVVGGVVDGRDLVLADALVLAPGHSARDTYRMLAAGGVALEAKEFAVGVRVEHPAAQINRIQYGRERLAGVPAADYSLRYNDPESGRGIYSFCMCPGGEIINSASEADGLVVNGMSRAARDQGFSNSALVVSVRSADWPEPGVLGGIAFQRRMEHAAFLAGGGRFFAPAQNLLRFAGLGNGPCRSSFRPGIVEIDLDGILPGFVAEALRRALPHFDRQMRGFVSSEAVLVGVETRTSAPLRIVRNETGESVSHPGLFPSGEGAGYAGGIMSAALDGMRAAEQIVQRFRAQES